MGTSIPSFDDNDSIMSGDVDLTALSATNVIAKGRPGYIFVPSRTLILVTTASGAISGGATVTGPYSITATGAIFFNSTQFAFGAPSVESAAISAQAAVAAGTDIAFAVTVAATGTGGFAFTGRLGFQGKWVKL